MTAHARVLHGRRWVFDTIEGGTPLVRAQVFNQLIIWLILVNVLVVILESVPSMHAEFGWYFLQFERLSLVIFGIEYLCRLWVAVEYPYVRQRGPWRGRLMFALRPSMLIDLLAIMPMVLAMLVPGIDSLILRLIRLLRFLKLARFSPAMTTVWDAIYGERRALAGAFVLMVGTAIFSGAVMHAVERA
ncbi:MAG TPA: cyclic nucleotide-binding protein, partial [Alphaproteobacteria bacterium]|nr:cyclic nucleotide-binding protein [Alphaproteobacteria bacterium]